MKNKNYPTTGILFGKILFTLLFISIIFCLWYFLRAQTAASINENIYLGKKITINEKQITIRQILDTITHNAGIYPFMSQEIARALNENVSISVTNERVDKVLRDLLEKRGYNVEFNDNAVLIYPKEIVLMK